MDRVHFCSKNKPKSKTTKTNDDNKIHQTVISLHRVDLGNPCEQQESAKKGKTKQILDLIGY